MKYIVTTIDITSIENNPFVLISIPILSGQYINKFAYDLSNLETFAEVFKTIDYEIVDLDASAFQVDYTPPTPIGYKILIPEYWEALFPDDKFIIGGFEAQLERKNNALVVDVAYLQWTSFREELLKPENATLARQMGAVMRYLEQQALNKDFV